MPQEFEKIEYLVGNTEILRSIETVKAVPVFADNVLAFLDALSKELMHSREAKQYPDIVAYAFWIRKASMSRAGRCYQSSANRIGRGVAFHIAPSNVPVQFAVSMTYALVSGNASVVRISQRNFEQVNIICDAIKKVLSDQFSEIAPYICIIRYEHDDSVTQALTDVCDIRMIWGGDSTIAAIRKAKLRPRCIDLGFADRYSIAVIESEEYMKKDAGIVAHDFYNDTYFFDQNACSSPRMIIWTGNCIDEAKERFWNAISDEVSSRYQMEPISASDKLLITALCAAKYPGVKEIKKNNLVVRLMLPSICDDIMKYKGNSGYFFEYDAKNLREIVPLLKKECQTITYIGNIEELLRNLITEYGVRGVDRIVPMGHGGDISFVWDGMDLPLILSRQIGDK